MSDTGELGHTLPDYDLQNLAQLVLLLLHPSKKVLHASQTLSQRIVLLMFMFKLECVIELKRVQRVEGGEESGLEMRCQERPSLQFAL